MKDRKYCQTCNKVTEQTKDRNGWKCSQCNLYQITLDKSYTSHYSHTPHRKHRY